MGGNVRSLWRSYWPLAVLPLAAGLLDWLLWLDGQAWSWADWASNFGLGAVTTMVVGMLLARRQGEVQEALAELELTEKVAILTAAVPLLRADSLPGPTYRSLYDCRAGMALVPLAREAMQEEYLRTVVKVLAAARAGLGSSLRSYTRWTDEDWADLAHVVEQLRETAVRNAGRSATLAGFWSREIDGGTRELRGVASGGLPFELFRRHFTTGPDRIRTSLSWDLLAGLDARGDGSVRLEKISTQVPPYEPGVLAGYFAPWYGDGQDEVGHDHPGAVPLRHTEIAAAGAVLAPSRLARIESLRDQYAGRMGGAEISLLLATYALGGNRFLVLDGNHRLNALARLIAQGCPVTLTEFRLTAPVDPVLLPDLAHFGDGAGAVPEG
ncbi:hypothetical protein [Streptomyces sp. NBC_01190]|uniref:hypothetical protein n=1 Tax=Streptomyces sp. NBC_01190 TaxID=2903767 RepID=UPI00386E912E|nr:hypothetical protein OG519_33615 [Streptomyces sp. NBC_01190]